MEDCGHAGLEVNGESKKIRKRGLHGNRPDNLSIKH
jgi:hypothetical protein